MSLPITVYYWGNPAEFAAARQLAAEDGTNGLKGITRDATVFDGSIEPCQKAVVLSGVHPGFAARIRRAYEDAGVEVERKEIVPGERVRDMADAKARADIEAAEKLRHRKATDQLRKLPTAEIRRIANERGVDISRARDRMQMIAALQHKR